MVNPGEFVGGALLGTGLGPFGDIARETLGKFWDFNSHRTDLQYKQKSLQPPIDEIEALNISAGRPDEIKDLKATMVEGDALDTKVKDVRVCSLMKPFHTNKLVDHEKSRQSRLEVLKVQGVRNGAENLAVTKDNLTVTKENLAVTKDSSQKLDHCTTGVDEAVDLAKENRNHLQDCKTGVQEIGDWTGKTTHRIDEVASDSRECVSLGRELKTAFAEHFELRRTIKDTPELEAVVEQVGLRKCIETLDDTVNKSSLPSHLIAEWNWLRESLDRVPLKRSFREDLESVNWGIPPGELKGFRLEIDKGVELVRKCARVTEWTDAKTEKYSNKLRGLGNTLQALAARLEPITLVRTKKGLQGTRSNCTITDNPGLAPPQRSTT